MEIKLGDVVAVRKGNVYGLMIFVHIFDDIAECVSFLDGEAKKNTFSFSNLTKIDGADESFLKITL